MSPSPDKSPAPQSAADENAMVLAPGTAIVIPLILGTAILAVAVFGGYRCATNRQDEQRRQAVDQVRGLFQECWALLRKRKYDKAEAAATQAIQSTRKFGETTGETEQQILATGYFCRAKARLELGTPEKRDQALADADECIRLNPRDYNAYLLRGRQIYEALERLPEAERDLTEALRLRPYFAAAFVERARIRQRRGNADGAQADRKRAQELGETDTR